MLYPLELDPILKDKVWGGRRLARLGKSLPEGAMVGESWELADLRSTSPEGGGGEAAHSIIAHGEMRGLSLDQAITALGVNLMGSLRLSPEGGFPLLVKFLDARQNLSVQVHPSPAYAATNPGAHLKTESWYVIDAEPGAVIYKGVRQGVTRERLATAIRDGTVPDLLVSAPVKAGDFHHLPTGTCHALGAGVLVAEIQTPSDTTFRLFDWGRKGRALHVQQALECITFGPPARVSAIRSDGSERFRLIETPAYTIDELSVLGDSRIAVENIPSPPVGGPMVWMCLSGQGRLESESSAFQPVEFSAGRTILFPAALGPTAAVIARDSKILEVRFPV